jgi:hypothetical protein
VRDDFQKAGAPFLARSWREKWGLSPVAAAHLDFAGRTTKRARLAAKIHTRRTLKNRALLFFGKLAT